MEGHIAEGFDIEAWIARQQKYGPLVRRIEKPSSLADRFSALREFYADRNFKSYNPYPYGIDWLSVFTPIEYDVWCDIRCLGLRFWPQLPVGRYFVDFGEPRRQIAIECDGKQWHDPAKDADRDAELAAMGWTVIRLTGSECYRVRRPDWEAMQYETTEEDREAVRVWLDTTSEGVLTALAKLCYGYRDSRIGWEDAQRTVRAHTTAGCVPVLGDMAPDWDDEDQDDDWD